MMLLYEYKVVHAKSSDVLCKREFIFHTDKDRLEKMRIRIKALFLKGDTPVFVHFSYIQKRELFKITYTDIQKMQKIWYMQIGFEERSQAYSEMKKLQREEQAKHESFQFRKNFQVEPIKLRRESERKL